MKSSSKIDVNDPKIVGIKVLALLPCYHHHIFLSIFLLQVLDLLEDACESLLDIILTETRQA